MSMLVYLICSVLLVIFSKWCFVSQRKHMLMILLSMEMIIFSMLLMLFWDWGTRMVKCLLVFYFWLFGVCEGSFSLSILVSIVRSHSND